MRARLLGFLICGASAGCPAEFTTSSARRAEDCGVCGDAKIACPITHVNGSFAPLGQSYWLSDGCKPLGVPGNESTYDSNMARAAAEAWPADGSIVDTECSAGRIICKGGTGGYASWGYTKTIAGHVYFQANGCGGPSKCCCPLVTDNIWN